MGHRIFWLIQAVKKTEQWEIKSGFGGFAEHVCVAEDAVRLKPAGMHFAPAAA